MLSQTCIFSCLGINSFGKQNRETTTANMLHGEGGAAGFAKVLPFTRPNFANFATLYLTKNAQLFLISIFCEGSRIHIPV